MRKSRIREIAAKYGDSSTGAMNPRTMDPVVFQISDLAEQAFGPDFVSELEEDISLTEASYSKKKSLAFLTSEFLRKYVANALAQHNVDKLAEKLRNLRPLSDETYVDYFSALTDFERHTFRTPMERPGVNVTGVLTAYTTETPFPVCDGIVSFFKSRKDDLGLFQLIQSLCVKIKEESKLGTG
jgi:hypothetical protein